MSRAKVYGLLMALAMLFMAGLCACSAVALQKNRKDFDFKMKKK